MCAPAALSLGAPPHSSAGDWQHPRHKGSAGGAEEATTGTHARASRGFCWRPRGERGAARGEDGALHEVLQHSRLRTPKSRGPTNSFVGADRRTGRGTGRESGGGIAPCSGGPRPGKRPAASATSCGKKRAGFRARAPRTRATARSRARIACACCRAPLLGAGRDDAPAAGPAGRCRRRACAERRAWCLTLVRWAGIGLASTPWRSTAGASSSSARGGTLRCACNAK